MIKQLLQKTWAVLDDRLGIAATLGPIMRHPVPRGARWWYVFGSATLCAFVIQVATGVTLAFSYIASSSQAYDTLLFITNEAPFGRFLRGLHYYGASAMVLMVGLHMAQVFLAGSYKFPREMNWLTGVLLLVFTLEWGSPGNSCAGIPTPRGRSSSAPSRPGSSPRRTLHCPLRPRRGHHRWCHAEPLLRHPRVPDPGDDLRVLGATPDARHEARHLRASDAGRAGGPEDVPAEVRGAPEEGRRAVLAGRGMARCGVCVCDGSGDRRSGMGPRAPVLDKPPDPSITDASPRPDWYLLWYFAVLALCPPSLETIVILAFPLIVGALLFSAPVLSNKGERSARRRPGQSAWSSEPC